MNSKDQFILKSKGPNDKEFIAQDIDSKVNILIKAFTFLNENHDIQILKI